MGSLLKPQSLIEQGAVAAVVSTSNLSNANNSGTNTMSNRVQNSSQKFLPTISGNPSHAMYAATSPY